MAFNFCWMLVTNPEPTGFAFMSCMEVLHCCSMRSVSILEMM